MDTWISLRDLVVERVLDVYLYDPLTPGTFVASQRITLRRLELMHAAGAGAVTVGDFDGNGTTDLVVADARPGDGKRLIKLFGAKVMVSLR